MYLAFVKHLDMVTFTGINILVMYNSFAAFPYNLLSGVPKMTVRPLSLSHTHLEITIGFGALALFGAWMIL